MCVVFCRCGISTRFSNRTPSTSHSHTGRPASSRNAARYREQSNPLPSVVLKTLGRATTTIPETDLLPDVIEHHRPPERRWQRRNQQTVVSPVTAPEIVPLA